jgi:hypothetical protein
MEDLIRHYLQKLEEKTLTLEQRNLYEMFLDEYSLMYLQDINS